MQQDPSWRRIHPQVRSAAVLGLVLKQMLLYSSLFQLSLQFLCMYFSSSFLLTATLLTGVSLLLQHWFFRDCQKYNQAAARAGGGINAMYHRCNQIDAV